MPTPEDNAKLIFLEALAACRVESALAEKLHVLPQAAAGPNASSQSTTLDLGGVTRLLVVAMGKAAGSVLHALLQRADIVDGRELAGVLISPQPLEAMPPGVRYFEGGHPLPNEASFAAARAVLELLKNEPPSPQTFCFFLISGGASAMVELPLDESIGLPDTVAFHQALVLSGATIKEMNCVRKHFSAVKGGRLGQHATHLRNLTLLVSDVPAAELDTLASGPTLPDASTVEQCRDVLKRYDLLDAFTESVRTFFAAKDLPETPKADELRPATLLLLSSADLAKAAVAAAEKRGFTAVVDNTCDDWEYREAAEYLQQRVRALRQEHGQVCLISVGELSLKVNVSRGTNRQGGRNQHFALHCAALFRSDDDGLAVLSCGSDGIDGNSPAAGAAISAAFVQQQDAAWLEAAHEALAAFSSFPFLRTEGLTIETGPTGTNLRDLRLLIA